MRMQVHHLMAVLKSDEILANYGLLTHLVGVQGTIIAFSNGSYRRRGIHRVLKQVRTTRGTIYDWSIVTIGVSGNFRTKQGTVLTSL